MGSIASHSASKGLAAAWCKCAWSFENANSIGFRSGEYWGKEQEPGATGLEDFGGLDAFVDRKRDAGTLSIAAWRPVICIRLDRRQGRLI
jgi:hypothetical protein